MKECNGGRVLFSSLHFRIIQNFHRKISYCFSCQEKKGKYNDCFLAATMRIGRQGRDLSKRSREKCHAGGQAVGQVLEAAVEVRPQAQSEDPDSAGAGPGRPPPCASALCRGQGTVMAFTPWAGVGLIRCATR